MPVGAHVPIGGGYESALRYAASVECECIQFFAKSPRMWRQPPIDAEAASAFEAQARELRLTPMFTHAAYLLNLCSSDPTLLARSTDALADEIVRASLFGAEGVVVHLGSSPDARPVAARRLADAVARAVEAAGEGAAGVRVLLENGSGGGNSFGGDVTEIGDVLTLLDGLVPRERVGVCLDTCHAFAYGYDLTSTQGWSDALGQLGDACGPDALRLIHANDCAFERGARRDRHAWVGEGGIGIAGFAAMMCERRLRRVPMITEMPGEPPRKDLLNLTRLKALRASCAGLSGSVGRE